MDDIRVLDPDARRVLRFWFGDEYPTSVMEDYGRWFSAPPGLNEAIVTEFSDLVHQAVDGKLNHWADLGPHHCLALIVLLDQYALNIGRERGDTFGFDSSRLAIPLSYAAVEHGYLDVVPAAARQFFMLPLMHSESLADQNRCVELYAQYGLVKQADFAESHREAIRRFGRFPNRNKVYGRRNTPEETAYLSSFTGWVTKAKPKETNTDNEEDRKTSEEQNKETMNDERMRVREPLRRIGEGGRKGGESEESTLFIPPHLLLEEDEEEQQQEEENDLLVNEREFTAASSSTAIVNKNVATAVGVKDAGASSVKTTTANAFFHRSGTHRTVHPLLAQPFITNVGVTKSSTAYAHNSGLWPPPSFPTTLSVVSMLMLMMTPLVLAVLTSVKHRYLGMSRSRKGKNIPDEKQKIQTDQQN